MREYVVQLEAVVPSLAATSVEDRQSRTDALLDTLETVARDEVYGIKVPAAFGRLGGKRGGCFHMEAPRPPRPLSWVWRPRGKP